MNFSIEEIKKILAGNDLQELLTQKKNELEDLSDNIHEQISKINFLLKENQMNYEVSIKALPECTVYYKEGYLKKYSDSTEFILSSADECLKDNPNIKCIEPDYCFMEYLDNEYKEENIHEHSANSINLSLYIGNMWLMNRETPANINPTIIVITFSEKCL